MDRTAENGTPEWRSTLLDVSEMSLEELRERAGESALGRSLSRLAEELDQPGEPIAGFNSAL